MGLRLVQVIIVVWDRPIRPVRHSMYRIARRLCRLVGQRFLLLPGFEPDSCSMMWMARQASGASQTLLIQMISVSHLLSHSLDAWREDKVSFREVSARRQASSSRSPDIQVCRRCYVCYLYTCPKFEGT